MGLLDRLLERMGDEKGLFQGGEQGRAFGRIRDLFGGGAHENIDEIINQYVDIYKISTEDTQENIYGESDKKYFKTGLNFLASLKSASLAKVGALTLK